MAPEGPEAALMAWLLWLPPGADPAEAARRELRRPAFEAPASRAVARLRDLLRAVAAARAPSSGRTGSH